MQPRVTQKLHIRKQEVRTAQTGRGCENVGFQNKTGRANPSNSTFVPRNDHRKEA